MMSSAGIGGGALKAGLCDREGCSASPASAERGVSEADPLGLKRESKSKVRSPPREDNKELRRDLLPGLGRR